MSEGQLEALKGKIRKLLRLASCKGATEAEATLAAEKVQALLDEHKLSMNEIGDTGDAPREHAERHEHAGRNLAAWASVTLKAVADTSYCAVIKKRGGGFIMFGKPSDAAVAKELWDHLCGQINRMGIKYIRENRDFSEYSPKTLGHAFRLGCASRVAQRLREAYVARQASAWASVGEVRALALVDDAKRAQVALRQAFPKLVSRTVKLSSAQNAHADGRAAGERVSLENARKLSGGPRLLG